MMASKVFQQKRKKKWSPLNKASVRENLIKETGAERQRAAHTHTEIKRDLKKAKTKMVA